jgi:hypothetical protein
VPGTWALDGQLMRKTVSLLALALASMAGLLLAPQTAHARGGSRTALSVPADWPATVPVPAGRISLIERDLTGNLTLHVTAADVVQATVLGVDQPYTAAGFTLDPASGDPRYLTRPDYIVTVYFRAHDFASGRLTWSSPQSRFRHR